MKFLQQARPQRESDQAERFGYTVHVGEESRDVYRGDDLRIGPPRST
jgi:hypothetical protein